MSWRSTLVLSAGLALGLSYAPAATAVQPNEPTPRKTVLVVHSESSSPPQCSTSATRAGRSCSARILPTARRRSALAAPAPDRRDARRARRAVALRRRAAGVVRRRHRRADRRRRGSNRGVAQHRAARPRRHRARDAALGLDPRVRRARRHDPPKQLHALRRPRRRDFTNCVTLYRWSHRVADRGQPLPRLPRLRLHPRTLRHAPDDPPQPLRPLAPVPHERATAAGTRISSSCSRAGISASTAIASASTRTAAPSST